MNYSELLAFILYLVLVVAVGVVFFLKTRGGDEKMYFLGGRQMNAWVAALSAGASDMSAWVLMGLPGSIYALGMGQVWISVGLAIGTALCWIFVAPRLRSFSIRANDAITIPQYLTNRFCSQKTSLQIICAIVFVVVYTVYAASSIKACGTLFNTVLQIDQNIAMYIAAGIIVIYTFLGGFNAVCWTDFFQGMLMLAALMIAPIGACLLMTSPEWVVPSVATSENYWNLLPSGKLDWASISTILSGIGWGLGYFGMPRILVRYMSIRSVQEVRKSRRIGIIWTFIILAMATVVGLVGHSFLPGLADESTIFINMVRKIFPSFISGVLLSAILAASMSTADSQLLTSASAFASDVYKPVIRKNASDREMMSASRIIIIVIAVAALLIAINPGSGTIMDLVECAWAAFGSAFGPAILLSLFWKRFTFRGAASGIVAGALADLLWLIFLSDDQFASLTIIDTNLYEIIPGFLIGLLVAVVVTLLDKKPSKEVEAIFDDGVEKAFKD